MNINETDKEMDVRIEFIRKAQDGTYSPVDKDSETITRIDIEGEPNYEDGCYFYSFR